MTSRRLSDGPAEIPASITVLPPDVLLLIFEDAVSDSLNLPWPQASYDRERAEAPFVLASVCNFWRQLAIETASLWAYLGFSDGEESSDVLELLILRSKDAPVDIYFHPVSCWDGEGAQCLAQLYTLVPRWRNIDIDYPRHESILSLAWLAEHQTPYLRSLSLKSQVSGEDDVERLTGVLPCAPHLRRMFVDDLAINWTFYAGGVPALTDLTIWLFEWEANSLCAFLTQVAGTLTTLALLGKTAQPRADADDMVTLPNLTRLTLHKPQWLGHIRAPNLERLELAAPRVRPDMIPLFSPFAQIKTLVLWGSTHPVDLKALELMSNITHLQFAVPSGSYKIYGRDNSYCHVYREFLERLALTEPPIWPLLRRISFGDDGDPFPHRVVVGNDGLSLLARRSCRATSGAANEETAPALRIQFHVASKVDSQNLRTFVEQLNSVRPVVSSSEAAIVTP